MLYFRRLTGFPSLRAVVSLKEVLQISHSKFFQIYEFTTGVSFMCFFPSSHSLKHSKWMYFIDPVQLQGLISGLLDSSSDRQILHMWTSDFSVFYLRNLADFVIMSYSFKWLSSNSIGLLSKPKASPLAKFKVILVSKSVTMPWPAPASFSNVVKTARN